MDLVKYQDGIYDTGKELAAYGVQCIKDRATLLKTTIYDCSSWQVVALQSAQIPTTEWSNRFGFMKAFKLVLTLNVSG